MGRLRWRCLLVAVLAASGFASAAAEPVQVRLWDTLTPLQAQAAPPPRTGWRAYASGPLQGDLVAETGAVTAVFASRRGAILLYTNYPGVQRASIHPPIARGEQGALAASAATEGGAVSVQVVFRAAGADEYPADFAFRGGRLVSITPRGSAKELVIQTRLDGALVPSLLGDDLLYNPRSYPGARVVAVPSEHLLLGFGPGEGSSLLLTWQEGTPAVRLTRPPDRLLATGETRPSASFDAITLTGATSFSLALLDAPGLWHREVLKPTMLQRDVPISWKPPYVATWLTQLREDDVPTTFEFRDRKENTWRGGVGNYDYPVWYLQGKTMLSLGKKTPPEGEAFIYNLERTDETPADVLTPFDVVKQTLTGPVLAEILSADVREPWFPQRPDAVIGAATCATTDAFLVIFRAGKEVEQKEKVKGGVEDMYFYLEHMWERNGRFYPFAKDMLAYLDEQQKAKPELRPYLDDLHQTAQEMVDLYDGARDTFRDMAYAQELGKRTIALTVKRSPANLQAITDLKQLWTGMGGSLEEVARGEHTLTRKLYQQAGYGAATRPEAIPIAEEIRRRTKRCLEKPESYEIWANY